MTEQRIAATIVNHVAVDISAPRDAVWGMIVEHYVEARKFGDGGYAIEPLDDPATVLGGFRMRLEQDGVVVDDRICVVTERDEEARRLSMVADYLSVPGGMRVYATYHAQEVAGGARYAIDCHTRMELDAPAGDGKADVATAIRDMTANFDTALSRYLESIKATLDEREQESLPK